MPKPLLIRVKRRADEEVSTPNKRFKFVATSDSANDDHIYALVSKECPTLPTVSQPNDRPEIRDYEEWSVKQNKTREIITCNGQPLVSAEKNESLDYLYDIYVYDDNQCLDVDNPSQYRECEDSEEDSNDEDYAYNDYPDEDEVSDNVVDYYEYSDLNRDLSKNNIDSDYDLSDEEEDPLKKYMKQKRLEESGEVDDFNSSEDYGSD